MLRSAMLRALRNTERFHTFFCDQGPSLPLPHEEDFYKHTLLKTAKELLLVQAAFEKNGDFLLSST